MPSRNTGNASKNLRVKRMLRITLRHSQLAIRGDEELERATTAGGGVPPLILNHP